MYANNPSVYKQRRTKADAFMNMSMNIIPEFKLATVQDAHGIQPAVYCLHDQYPVFPGTTVDATTDGTGQVATMLRQLKALDAGSWFAPAFASVQILTLDEVFETVSQHDRAME